MKKRFLSVIVLSAALFSVQAQEGKGGISPEMLGQIKQSYQGTAADKALRNAIGNNDIRKLALNQENMQGMDTHFSIKVESKGITDQKSSGRCWLFTGLNVMRAKTLAEYGFQSFEFSEVYPFFWDQLEKANLFLQGIIDTSKSPLTDKTVEWLFQHPLSDGGTFTGVADIVSKYGLVPKDAMPETNSSENTSRMANLISLKLKEYGLQLRDMAAAGAKPEALEKEKTTMLGTIYRMLVLNLGVPPTEFDYVRHDAKGNPVETEHHTPMSFLEKYGDKQLLLSLIHISISFSQTGDMERSRSIMGGRISRIYSTSSIVFSSPRERRSDPCAISWGRPMARSTWLGSSEPEVHAEPEEAQIPFISSSRRSDSPSIPSKAVSYTHLVLP